MTQDSPSPNPSRKLPLLWLGLAVGLILTVLITINLTQTVEEGKKVEKIPVNASPSSQSAADFPSALVYPEASFVHSEKGEQESYNAELSTAAPVPTVASWYVDTLASQGWAIDTPSGDPNNKDVQTIRAVKGEQSFIVSAIRNPDNKTKIVLGQWQQIPDDEDGEYQEE